MKKAVTHKIAVIIPNIILTVIIHKIVVIIIVIILIYLGVPDART